MSKLEPKQKYIGKTMEEIFEDTKKWFSKYPRCKANGYLSCSYIPTKESPEGCAFRRLFENHKVFADYETAAFHELLKATQSFFDYTEAQRRFFSLLQTYHDNNKRRNETEELIKILINQVEKEEAVIWN